MTESIPKKKTTLGKNASQKAPSSDVARAIIDMLPDITEERFHLRLSSDDGGRLFEAVIERNEFEEEPEFETRIDPYFMGWRVVMLIVPHGYIETFYCDEDMNKLL